MRLLWTEIKYVKSVASVLDRILVNKGGLDHSIEVLWDSVGQRAAVLQAVKVGGKKNSADRPGAGKAGSNQADWQNFFLTSNFVS